MESKLGAKTSKRSSTIHQPQSRFHGSSFKDLQAGLLHSPRKKPKRQLQPDEFPSKEGDGVSHFIAKDLRIKRVFSPNLPDENGSPVPSGEQISDKEGPIIANGSCPIEDEGVRNSSEAAEVRNVDVCNSGSCLTNGYVELGDEGGRCNGVSTAVNGKSEQLTHSTPPDAEILVGNFVVVSSDGCHPSSNGCVEGDTYANTDGRIGSLSRTGSVLEPCIKRKLFKAPGSIAYKRLLPYLLDTDNYTLQGYPYSKREKNLEKKANIESNLCNRAKESSSVDSDNCVKNAAFPSSMSCKAMKLNLPPPDKIISFSKPSVNVETEIFRNGNPSGNQKCSDSNNDPTIVKEGSGLKTDNVVCASSNDKRPTENGGPTKHQTEHLSYKEQSKTSGLERLDGGSSFIPSNASSEVENYNLCVSKKLSNNVSENIKKKDSFNEELQLSSLDSNIPCNPVKEERRDEKVECTQGADQNLGSSTVGENQSNICTESDKKHGSYARNKVVRNQLVRLKLFNSQASVNYRRMLPFLENLFKDNSENCALGNINCPRLEKELATTNLQPPSSNSHNALEKSEGFVSCKKPCDGSSDTLSMTESNTMNEKMHQLHSEQELLNECKLEVDPQLHGAALLLNDQAVSPLYPAATYEPVAREGSRMITKQSPITSENCTSLTDNVSDGAKLSERNSLGPNSSCVEACILPENPANVRKGILKRNPRGCRGICTCLNCSSFRLHAERAFEFSRNQLQDAEEVTSDLMKELSFLRDVLQKFSDGVKDTAGYHSNKVKEACRKASEAESIAKGRLLQMNYELDIHCRITCSQRPNVRFSGDVENIEIEDGK